MKIIEIKEYIALLSKDYWDLSLSYISESCTED